MVPLAHARWSADRRAVVTPEAGDQHRVVDRRGDRRGAAGAAAAGGRGAAEPDDGRPGTGLRQVALARRGAAHGARVAGRMLAAGARAVAGVGGARIALVRAGGAGVAHRVRARRARARARVGGAGVAVVGARRRARLEGVGRAGGARAGAALGRVTLVDGGATHGPRVPGRMLAGHVGAVALVEGAGVGFLRAGGPALLLGVGRRAAVRAGAGLGQVALAGRGAADGARVPGRMVAGRARAVAALGGAGAAVAGAGGAGRLDGSG